MNVRWSVLQALAPAERRTLFQRCVRRSIGPREALFLAGDRAEQAYLLVRGVIMLGARTGEGRETILALALPGDVVGEVAVLEELPQPLDAIAATGCELLGFEADLLARLLERNGRACLELARGLARRSRWICDTALERTSSEVPARLAGRLLDLADRVGRVGEQGIEMDLPLAQEDLGRLAGMCRESACKTLRSFKREGFVDYRGRRLRILRPDALERIRCAGRMRAAGRP